MSQFVMSRREFAGVVVSMTVASMPATEPDRSRRVVALGRISQREGQVTVSSGLAGSKVTSTRVGR